MFLFVTTTTMTQQHQPEHTQKLQDLLKQVDMDSLPEGLQLIIESEFLNPSSDEAEDNIIELLEEYLQETSTNSKR